MMSVETARAVVGRTTIECCVRRYSVCAYPTILRQANWRSVTSRTGQLMDWRFDKNLDLIGLIALRVSFELS